MPRLSGACKTVVALVMAIVLTSIVVLVCTVIVSGIAMANNNATTTESISAHVLDIGNGMPGRGVQVTAWYWEGGNDLQEIGQSVTDINGRVSNVHPGKDLKVGTYKIRFEVEDYFRKLNQTTFYPYAEVVFKVDDAQVHYHIPLTLSRFGYTTYKGQ